MAKSKVTGVRLNEDERKQLRRLGNGSISLAIRDAIDAWFRLNKVTLPK